jgi:hypothetical protein
VGCSDERLLAFAPAEAARDCATNERRLHSFPVSRSARFVRCLEVTFAAISHWSGVQVLRTVAACRTGLATAAATWPRLVARTGASCRSTRARLERRTAHVRTTVTILLRHSRYLMRGGYEATAAWNMRRTTAARRDDAHSITFVLGIIVGAVLVGYVRPVPEPIVTAVAPARPTGGVRPLTGQSRVPDVVEGLTGRSRPDQPAPAAVSMLGTRQGAAPVSSALKTERRRQEPQPYRGSLLMTSVPQGAAVFINGHHAGTTPLILSDLPVGSRAVRLTIEGYDTWSRAVQVVANRRTEVNAALTISRPVLARSAASE